jgi:dTDP-glucose pyrophosphorylase
MIKKVVIAAAGRGTRMRHLTKNKPKHLIKVCNKPFLSYLFDNLLRAGYKELILVAGYKKEKMEEFLKRYKYKACLVDQFKILGEKEYGTACPLKCVKDIVEKENFLMINGDHIFSVRDLASFNIDDKYNYISCVEVPNPEKYGVLKVKNGFLEKVIEKPKQYIGNLVNNGIYRFTPEVFSKLFQIKMSKAGEYEVTDVINLLAKERKVKVKRIKDNWVHFTNPADIITASNFVKNENS